MKSNKTAHSTKANDEKLHQILQKKFQNIEFINGFNPKLPVQPEIRPVETEQEAHTVQCDQCNDKAPSWYRPLHLSLLFSLLVYCRQHSHSEDSNWPSFLSFSVQFADRYQYLPGGAKADER